MFCGRKFFCASIFAFLRKGFRPKTTTERALRENMGRMLTWLRKKLWKYLARLYPSYLNRVYGMHIAPTAVISYRAKLDKSVNPGGIHIGDDSWVLAEAMVLAHDQCRNLKRDTMIGRRCVIGVRSLIMAGVNIGDHVVVGAGVVVTKDVPAHCLVVGNPAKIIKRGIRVNQKGQIISPARYLKT